MATRYQIISTKDLATGVATFLATPSSANLATAITDETGSGALVFATSPTLVTPALGTPASGVLTNCTGTAQGLTAGFVTSARGFVNQFRNNCMDIWQRQIGSGSIATGVTNYTADGWMVTPTGATVTWAQAGEITTSNFSLKLTGNTSMTSTILKQRIESFMAAHLLNINTDNVTVQFRIQNTTGGTITPTLTVKHATALDNWGATVTDVNAVSLQSITNSSITTVAYTFTPVAGTQNGLEIGIDFGSALNANTKTVFVTDCDIRVTPGVATGLNSSPPLIEQRDIATEWLLNQRYLAGFGTIAGPIATGVASSTTAAGFFIPFDVTMRAAPTGLTITTVGDMEIATYAAADVAALSGMTFSKASPNGAFVTTTVASGLIAAQAYFLYAKTALQGNLIFTGAEL